MNFDYIGEMDNYKDCCYHVKIEKDGNMVTKILQEENISNTEKIAKNNLNTIEEIYDFFVMLYYFFINNSETEINLCLDKLNYLGYTYTGIIDINYNDEQSMIFSLIQVAFLWNMERDNKKAKLTYHYLLDCIELISH